MKVTVNKNNEIATDSNIVIHDLLRTELPKVHKKAVAVKINGKLAGLYERLSEDTDLEIVTFDDPEGREVFWHSASHIMAAAVKELYGDVQLGIGPAISNGFYYDFSMPDKLSNDDLPRIEEKMREIIERDIPFTKTVLPREEAEALFTNLHESFKLELIRDLGDETISTFSNDGLFTDLCRGPHVFSTGVVQHITLLSVAGAYWHGNENNPVMQRIYGTAYPDAKQLKQYLHALEEAKKRDHRKLGKELDLFSFQQEGPGFPFWHPDGMVIYNGIMDYMRTTLIRHGYGEVKTPMILNERLWHRSGHWDNYKENMYFTSIDEQTYAVKPMNCPGSLLIYKNSLHSYRDLPLKLSEMGGVHRHEKSGVLHGLFRVRYFTQDDAHVFCTPDQMEDEIVKLIDLVSEVYATFGFTSISLEMSTRPAKSIGSDDMWERAENALANALNRKGVSFQVNAGDGAFYGPKIDFHIEDSVGRSWQCGTIQVDFSMPERFELEYVGADGERHVPVMIHRAILGSVERFFGILVEHYGGAFPIWLAPVQCLLMPITDRHHEYALNVMQQLTGSGIRCRLDDRNEKVGFKIREAEKKKIPFVCVIGDEEVEGGTVSVRRRKQGNLGSMETAAFLDWILELIVRRDNN
ncbi:threonine--tRNA ligase [bacterium]|nr:threonine--tRNA ligase [bacterium]